ncbi:MAG: acyclic terpene utilization AtuA family protein [Lachnospiraceae bacterium]|nr:acyclic terpene utilization AtuA family protein [Lachnospiraceae bacterium]
MKSSVKILSPCGILGYGFPQESFVRGIAMKPDAIVVDAGSTDAGPHKLGASCSIVSRMAMYQDLQMFVEHGVKAGIPVVIGSAGGAGAASHVQWTLDILNDVLKDAHVTARVAVVHADIPHDVVDRAIGENRILPMGSNIPPLTEEIVHTSGDIVAQMGHEPVIRALDTGADIIVCGRAYDPSSFAAVCIREGFDPGLAYHMGKVLECGALCAEPGTTKDCIMGTIYSDHFEVEALNPERRCTVTTVAAHTFYEKENPCVLHGPGFVLDLTHCRFEQSSDRAVAVYGSRYEKEASYNVKLEGARKVAYRTFVVSAVRDPLLIGQIEEVEEMVKQSVRTQLHQLDPDSYQMNYYNYGIDGIMGSTEPDRTPGHEICVMFEALAKTQEIANTVCASMRSTLLHYGYPGRKSTAGNLAFPFAPSDVPFGPVYQFSVYHLMQISDPLELFPVECCTMPR